MGGDAYWKYYEKVPADKLEDFKKFRKDHPVQERKINSVTWEYLSGGESGEALILLPGEIGNGEELLYSFHSFENDYRLICPVYPLTQSMQHLVDGILSILDAEKISRFHLLGHSLGGFLAQMILRAVPERVNTAILAHTAATCPPTDRAMARRKIERMKATLAWLPFLPMRLLRYSAYRDIRRHLSKIDSPEKEFLQAYYHEQSRQTTREYLAARLTCFISFYQSYYFYSDDLVHWPGKILILESDGDLALDPLEQSALKELYPQARIHTFTDSGHLALFTNQQAALPLIRKFLEERRENQWKRIAPQIEPIRAADHKTRLTY